MPKINTSRTISIHSSKDKVAGILRDLNHWRPWSPWLINEPGARVDVSEDGCFQEWDGKRIGSGQLRLAAQSDSRLDFDLVFLKPWKSKAKTSFNLTEKDGLTQVTWNMNSSLPFFMFWMKKKMEIFIGMDYERGLKMLKQYVEEGKVSSAMNFMGVQDYAGTHYVGIDRTCSFSRIGDFMQEDFNALLDHEALKPFMNGDVFAQYHKFDMVRDVVNYTAGVGVKEFPTQMEANWNQGKLPAMKLQTIRHTGWFDYIGNAWSMAQSMIRAKEFKPQKGIHPLEFYRNNYREVSPDEVITDVCFAV